ncbi:MAG TPA: PIG-L family deacetylase, partial [Leptolyngbyaceae cyanobacterium M65_K2018_010]|nr:PIG-L family deacetylase [Leptolyngbyaceae cyanobacterium M65_K2018_010]
PQAVSFLNQPDGELATLTDGARQALIAQLVDLLKSMKPEEVYVTYRHDKHPDHEEAAQLVRAAIDQAGLSIQLMEYPIWSLYQPLNFDFRAPEFRTLHRLPIQAVRAQKLRAITCHRSQYEPIPPDTHGGLPKGFIERLSSPYEFFFVSSSSRR